MDTATAGPLSQFREDEQHQEGEEQEELSEEQPLPHPLCTQEQMQDELSSGEIQKSEGSSQTSMRPSKPTTTTIVQFPNEEDWTLWLNEQLDRVFQ